MASPYKYSDLPPPTRRETPRDPVYEYNRRQPAHPAITVRHEPTYGRQSGSRPVHSVAPPPPLPPRPPISASTVAPVIQLQPPTMQTPYASYAGMPLDNLATRPMTPPDRSGMGTARRNAAQPVLPFQPSNLDTVNTERAGKSFI